MLKEYYEQEIQNSFYELLENDEEYTADYSEFVVIDGEEGDYGLIKYFREKDLVAVKHVLGGDDEYYEFTDFGKWWFNVKLINLLHKSQEE